MSPTSQFGLPIESWENLGAIAGVANDSLSLLRRQTLGERNATKDREALTRAVGSWERERLRDATKDREALTRADSFYSSGRLRQRQRLRILRSTMVEDARYNYGERRFVSFGWLAGRIIAIVHTEDDGLIRIISARKASKYEQQIYFVGVASPWRRKSETDWARLDAMTDADIDLSDCPEVTPDMTNEY